MYPDLSYLSVDLPEDILKLKWYGDYERALRVIDMRLQKDIPEALKQRLIIEKDIIRLLPQKYPYSFDEALKLLQDNIRDFTAEELDRLRDEDSTDWIYVMGEVRFRDNILENVVKTRKEFLPRVTNKELLEDRSKNFEILDKAMKKMKKKGELTYKVHVNSELKIKKSAERVGETVRVHMPIPKVYAQIKDFGINKTSPKATFVSPADHPHRSVFFETKLQEDQKFIVDYDYVVTAKYVDLKPEEVSPEQPKFYLEEQAPHIRFTPYLRKLVEEVVGDETNPLLKARKIYDYITSHTMYSFVRPYFLITDITGYISTSWKGDCGIQALLFITMCRIAGVPARWQSGLYAAPHYIGCHDWAQFFVAPYGWLYADCSFGGSALREGSEERWNFYFGNLDPFRIPANSEFQYDFMPPKKFLRNDPYDNQVGEVEYLDRGLDGDEYECTHLIVKMTEQRKAAKEEKEEVQDLLKNIKLDMNIEVEAAEEPERIDEKPAKKRSCKKTK